MKILAKLFLCVTLLATLADGCITAVEELDCTEQWETYMADLSAYHALKASGVTAVQPTIPLCDTDAAID